MNYLTLYLKCLYVFDSMSYRKEGAIRDVLLAVNNILKYIVMTGHNLVLCSEYCAKEFSSHCVLLGVT